jgi:hypothetical protein
MIRHIAAASLTAACASVCALAAGSSAARQSASSDLTRPIVAPDVIFEERDGLVAVEAEHFFEQTLTRRRAWYITAPQRTPAVVPDGDPPHTEGASGSAYVESLPDTRRTREDRLISGENFSNEAGRMAVLAYKVHFNRPGRYYVWARSYSTGTEDNGLHVGVDGRWPESGRRLQWTGRDRWFWDSKQRTEQVHTGVPGQLYLDISRPGEHVITFSMREDGFEFDRWLMTTDREFRRPEGVGPAPARLKAGKLPAPFPPAGQAGHALPRTS